MSSRSARYLPAPHKARPQTVVDPRIPRPSSQQSGAALLWVDSGTGTITLSGTAVQSQTHTASGSGSVAVSGTKSETYIYADSRAGSLTLSGTRTESTSHSLTTTGTITTQTGTVAESNISTGSSDFTGHSTIEFVLGTGTTSESTSHTASAAGSLTLTGSSVESRTHTSSGSGTISLSGTAVESQSFGYTDSGSGTIIFSYYTGTAYPGDSFPGEAYPGQTEVTTPSRDSQTRSGSITYTLSGSGTDSYSTGATVTNDAMSGTISLSGDLDQESLGALDSSSGYLGAVVLSGTSTSHQSWSLTLDPSIDGSLTYPSLPPGTLVLVASSDGTLTLVPQPEGVLPLDPLAPGTLLLDPV